VGTCVISSCTYIDKDISKGTIYTKYIGRTVHLKYPYNLYMSPYEKENYRKYYITSSTCDDYLVAGLEIGHPLYIEKVRLRGVGDISSAIALGLVTVNGTVYEFEQEVAMYEDIGQREPSWTLPSP
jgi:hypothetical protein